ncbi:hypothetical protein T310_7651 [Rasamsonia emersonii CBS 393.64]|uniref:Uncharacterized protein n=1 Tax=Rasamsonia emersonii (strain ATCC 16479 / CBS 393.64 / IMI 116815) TaxID=1408163 RepID=A0A0F4YJL1_RASE3|nr:hypothetical protein T310_7651 [Rasamsonia emersonii CBS 393.64]KKA18409.1 hypothetical protein T310_7651 [Rasamsonia emersonii CBS 393.64]
MIQGPFRRSSPHSPGFLLSLSLPSAEPRCIMPKYMYLHTHFLPNYMFVVHIVVVYGYDFFCFCFYSNCLFTIVAGLILVRLIVDDRSIEQIRSVKVRVSSLSTFTRDCIHCEAAHMLAPSSIT